jgi:acyl dehydratase
VERAKGSRWQGLIASGWQTCGVAMRLLVEGALRDSESFGSPGLEYLKWLAPVRPGDALIVVAEVLDVRRSERQPALGIVRWRWTVRNQNDEAVLELVATSLFDLAG